jgi:hypothetical protein
MQDAVATRAPTPFPLRRRGDHCEDVHAETRSLELSVVSMAESLPTPCAEEWDELFQAVTERLSLAVQPKQGDSVRTPANSHDIVSSVRTAVDECVGELQMLGRVVREERSWRSKELELARAQEALARAPVDVPVAAS